MLSNLAMTEPPAKRRCPTPPEESLPVFPSGLPSGADMDFAAFRAGIAEACAEMEASRTQGETIHPAAKLLRRSAEKAVHHLLTGDQALLASSLAQVDTALAALLEEVKKPGCPGHVRRGGNVSGAFEKAVTAIALAGFFKTGRLTGHKGTKFEDFSDSEFLCGSIDMVKVGACSSRWVIGNRRCM